MPNPPREARDERSVIVRRPPKRRRRNGRWRPTRLALAALTLSLVVSAAIGIAIILVGDFDETEMRVLATAGVLAGFSVLSLPSLFHLERAQHRLLARVGISASVALFAFALYIIWGGEVMGGEPLLKALVSVGVVALGTNHALLMLIAAPSKLLITLCQRATVLVIAAVGVLVLVAVWADDMPDPLLRPFGALVVLDALGTVTVPILARTSRPR